MENYLASEVISCHNLSTVFLFPGKQKEARKALFIDGIWLRCFQKCPGDVELPERHEAGVAWAAFSVFGVLLKANIGCSPKEWM
ncbi:MAG: hypothetical protein WBX22_14020 [Silvibacterium sp.]|jgi:hypothetical protein